MGSDGTATLRRDGYSMAVESTILNQDAKPKYLSLVAHKRMICIPSLKWLKSSFTIVYLMKAKFPVLRVIFELNGWEVLWKTFLCW